MTYDILPECEAYKKIQFIRTDELTASLNTVKTQSVLLKQQKYLQFYGSLLEWDFMNLEVIIKFTPYYLHWFL